jgi:DNA invertase Pin-like site-specific DNA recombinase
MHAFAYLRVSRAEQGISGLGMEAQLHAIEQEVERKGWAPACVYSEVASGKDMKHRPMLQEALVALDRGEGTALVVAKLDRLARSTLDFATIMARAKRHGWEIVCLDVAVDTTSPTGRLMLNTVANFADFEREVISRRTIDALEVARARGTKLGRPRSLDPVIRRRIFVQSHSGDSLRSISRDLNNEQIPCARAGSKWWPTTVKKILDGMTDEEREQYRASLRS